MEHSCGNVRADKAHEKLLALGYAGSERTTRRAVAQVRLSVEARSGAGFRNMSQHYSPRS